MNTKVLQWNDNKVVLHRFEMTFEMVYLALFMMIFVDMFLHTTMFVKMFGNHAQLHWFLRIGVATVSVAKLSLTDKRSLWRTMLLIVLTLCFLAAYYRRSRWEELIIMSLLIIGANNVSFKKILSCYVLAGTVLTIGVMISAQMGIIENLVYIQSERSARHAFGSVYPTDFSAHIVYIVMAYAWIRQKRLTYIELALMAGCGVFVQVFCDARTNAGCIMIFVVLCLISKVYNVIVGKKNLGRPGIFISAIRKSVLFLSANAVFILSIVMVALSAFYTENSPLMVKLNDLFSTRLEMGKKGLIDYGTSIFGQYIPMQGFGGTLTLPENYFFLDSSYMKALLGYGYLVFACIWIVYFVLAYRAGRRRDSCLIWIIGVTGIQCMFEHHILEIAYNPFILAVVANLDRGWKFKIKEKNHE